MVSWDNFIVPLAIINKNSPKLSHFPVLCLDSPRETPRVTEPPAWEPSAMFHSTQRRGLGYHTNLLKILGDLVWTHQSWRRHHSNTQRPDISTLNSPVKPLNCTHWTLLPSLPHSVFNYWGERKRCDFLGLLKPQKYHSAGASHSFTEFP